MMRDLPVIPNFEGWAAGGNLSQQALEYENEKRAALQEMKEAIEALQAATGPELIDPGSLQSKVAVYTATSISIPATTQTIVPISIDITPIENASKMFVTAILGANYGSFNQVTIELLFNGAVVGTQKGYVINNYCQRTFQFEHTPGAAGNYQFAVTTSAGSGNIIGEGMTSLRIDEIRQD